MMKELLWGVGTGVAFVFCTELVTATDDTLMNPLAWLASIAPAMARASGQAGLDWLRRRRIPS